MLCNPPFNRSFAAVGHMTPRQVSEILFCERDEDGQVEPDTEYPAEPQGFRASFVRKWKRHGLRDDQIEVLWSRLIAKNPRLRALGQRAVEGD